MTYPQRGVAYTRVLLNVNRIWRTVGLEQAWRIYSWPLMYTTPSYPEVTTRFKLDQKTRLESRARTACSVLGAAARRVGCRGQRGARTRASGTAAPGLPSLWLSSYWAARAYSRTGHRTQQRLRPRPKPAAGALEAVIQTYVRNRCDCGALQAAESTTARKTALRMCQPRHRGGVESLLFLD
jgi:hypothetical protein